jgi:hypothetical protein
MRATELENKRMELEKENQFKIQELKVRVTEAENKRMELDLLKEKQAAELEEKKKMSDILFKILEKNMNP